MYKRMKVAGVPVKPDRKGSEGQIGLNTSRPDGWPQTYFAKGVLNSYEYTADRI